MPSKPRTTPSKKLPADLSPAPAVLWQRSITAMSDERWVDAIADLKLFLPKATEEDKARAYQNLGACYLELGLYEDAQSALAEARKLMPDNSDLLLIQGVADACQGKIKEAILNFETYRHRLPVQAQQQSIKGRLQILRRIERGELPQSTYRYNLLVQHLEHNAKIKEYRLVEHKAQELIALLPERPEGLFYLGLAYLNTGRIREAIDAFASVAVQDPQNETVRYNLAYSLIKDGRIAEAIPNLEVALQLAPEYLEAMHEIGVACLRLGRRAEAIQWWKKALQIDPDFGPVQWRLYEIGEGPAPEETSPTPQQAQLRAMASLAKQCMSQPTIVKRGNWTVTYQSDQGFVFEDSSNPNNITVYTGKPFLVQEILDEGVLNFIGAIKLALKNINAANTRDIALLIYYTDGNIFNYQASYQAGKQVHQSIEGQFRSHELPLCFKLRIDCDLPLPYVSTSRGYIIYLNQNPQPGFWISSIVD